MADLSKLLAVAQAEAGYLEKASNGQLDDKGANAGSSNYTKYNRDMIAAVPGIFAQPEAWCGAFVDWCFLQAFGAADALTLLGGWSAYTPTMAGYFRAKGAYISRGTGIPQAGDVAFYCENGVICHTGIVSSVDSANIHTIEGNTSGVSGLVANGGGVCSKTHALTSAYIDGYGRPAYGAQTATTAAAAATKTTGGTSTVTITLTVCKQGMKGVAEIKTIQRLLNALGYKGSNGAALDIDGSFGPNTDYAVRAFQKAGGLGVDGSVGTNTWTKLLR